MGTQRVDPPDLLSSAGDHDVRPKLRKGDALVLAILLVAFLSIIVPGMNRARGPHPRWLRCKNNLKSIGQAIALYTDAGTDHARVRYLIDNGFGVLVETSFIVEAYLICPCIKKPADVGWSYELNPAHSSGLQEHTWLVRDKWKRGFDDHTGNNNQHGKRKFNFLHGDMNYVGDADEYFDLYE